MNSTSVGHTFPEMFGAANEDNVEEMGRTFQENGVRMIHNALTGVHFCLYIIPRRPYYRVGTEIEGCTTKYLHKNRGTFNAVIFELFWHIFLGFFVNRFQG